MNQPATANLADELEADYYLHHFTSMMEQVERLYTDLLTQNERGFLRDFKDLSHDAACLLIRLVCRRGDWFRLDKLSYQEITDIRVAVVELIESKLLLEAVPPFEAFIKSTTIPELTILLDESSSLSKAALSAKVQVDYEQISATQPWRWLKLNCRQAVQTMKLCYFGNTHQELNQFVLVDLGIQVFEAYPVLSEDRKFNRREHIDSWLRLDQLMSEREGLSNDELNIMIDILLSIDSDHPSIKRKLSRCLNTVARDLERQRQFELALTLYLKSTLAPARERAIRCLEKIGDLQGALGLLAEVLEELITEPYLSYANEETETLKRLGRRLLSKVSKQQLGYPERLTSHLLQSISPADFGVQTYRLVVSNMGSAEYSLIRHIEQQGWQGQPAKAWYVENHLLRALFGLAFWDIIFARQKGMFVHPFQLAPLDMFHHEFIARRSQAINLRLKQLEAGEVDIIEYHLRTKWGVSNVWVNWKGLDKSLISKLVEHLSAKQLTGLMQAMLTSPAFMRAGMPDLLLLVGSGQASRLEWVEVKGPGDKLQDNQRVWLSQLATLGLSSSLCHVGYLDKNQ